MNSGGRPWTPQVAFGLATVLLFLKVFLVALSQGIARVANRAFVNADDAKFFGRGVTPREEELEYVARAQRTLRNDVENIPLALILALAWIQLGCWPEGLAWCLGVFVAARYPALHFLPEAHAAVSQSGVLRRTSELSCDGLCGWPRGAGETLSHTFSWCLCVATKLASEEVVSAADDFQALAIGMRGGALLVLD